jgi:4-hydroxybenzoate polyprenyltransferase
VTGKQTRILAKQIGYYAIIMTFVFFWLRLALPFSLGVSVFLATPVFIIGVVAILYMILFFNKDIEKERNTNEPS